MLFKCKLKEFVSKKKNYFKIVIQLILKILLTKVYIFRKAVIDSTSDNPSVIQ